MILAVDIGNSNIVLGGVREKEILFQARIVTDHIKTSDQYCAELKTMLDLFGVSAQEIEGSIVASVVPPVLNSFRTAIRKLTGKSCLVVGLASRQASTFSLTIPPKPARIWWQAPWLPCGNISLP